MRRTRASGSSAAHGIGVMNASYAPFRPSATKDFRHSFRLKPAYRWAARPPAGRGWRQRPKSRRHICTGYFLAAPNGARNRFQRDRQRGGGPILWRGRAAGRHKRRRQDGGEVAPPRSGRTGQGSLGSSDSHHPTAAYYGVIRFTFVRLHGPFLTRPDRAFSFDVHRGGAALRPGPREGRAVQSRPRSSADLG